MAKKEKPGKAPSGKGNRKKTSGHADRKQSHLRAASRGSDASLGVLAAFIQTEMEDFLVGLARSGQYGGLAAVILADLKAFLRDLVRQEVRAALKENVQA